MDVGRQKLIKAMDAAGYWYDNFDSYEDWVVFRDGIFAMMFESWEEVEEWLKGVVFDDPEVSDKVEAILNRKD